MYFIIDAKSGEVKRSTPDRDACAKSIGFISKAKAKKYGCKEVTFKQTFVFTDLAKKNGRVSLFEQELIVKYE